MTVEISLACRVEVFLDSLKAELPPKNMSDRTCFRHVGDWLAERIRAGQFTDDIFIRVLSMAKDSKLPPARNPRACFMKTLVKELGYESPSAAR
jgi:hypothetical protein